MSFIPAVRREISIRAANDPVRLTLEYFLQHGIGHNNPVPLQTIVQYLQSRGVSTSDTHFQQTILADSRDRAYFIASGNRGYFLIDTIDDARRMASFYETRINAEQQNLDNLRMLSTQVGWTL